MGAHRWRGLGDPGSPWLALPPPPLLLLLLQPAVLLLSTATGSTAQVPRLVVLEPRGADTRGNELQMSAGQALRLRCEGSSPLRWSFPLPDEGEVGEVPQPSVEEETLGLGRHASTLHLANASFFHTGLYSCAPHTDTPDFLPDHTSDHDAARHAAIYVYVADPEYPWVRVGIVPSWAKQYEAATLDCRTNNRSLHVRLLDSVQKEIPLGENMDTGWTLHWAPSVGFTLDPVNDRDGGVYFCRVTSWDDVMVMLTVMPSTTNLSPPTIHAIEAVPHAVLGKNMELQCLVQVTGHVFFDMAWIRPNTSTALEDGRLNITSPSMIMDPLQGIKTGMTNLTLVNVTESDGGLYTCIVTDHLKKSSSTSFHVDVKDGSVFFINVQNDPAVLHQEVRQDMNATWVLDVVTYPPHPTLSVFGPDGNQLTAGSASKFPFHTRARGRGIEVVLSVVDADLRERGTYSLKINTRHEEKIVNLTLTVLAAPVVVLQPLPEPSHVGEERSVWCRVMGSPLPEMEWAWKECPGPLHECSPEGHYVVLKGAPLESMSDVEANSTLKFRPKASGYLSCRARNDEEASNDTAGLQVTDMPGPRTLEAWGPVPAVEGDDLELWCGALRENHTQVPTWERKLRNKTHALDKKRTKITLKNTTLSLRSVLRIFNARIEDSGSYDCITSDGVFNVIAPYQLDVKSQQSPFERGKPINDTEWLVSPSDKLRLPCTFDGLPAPVITWFKDNKRLVLPAKGDQFRLEDGNRTLVMAFVTDADQGEYRCRAANRLGTEERWVRILLRNRKVLTTGMIVLIVILVLLTICVVPLSYVVWRDRRRRKMMIMGLHNFAEGQPDVLNPDLPADDQAELLPYDRKWEFPRERLKLGKQLGAGAFGVVLKAEAQGIVEGEESTTVAVKMVKRTSNFSYLKALASELKIMVHLGRHLNVVNLLGACTDHIERQELLVIVEYCRFGNLHNYLLRHREGFVDQVDPRTGQVDAAIGADRLQRQDSFSRCGPGGRVKYASLSFSGSDTTGGSDAGSETGGCGPMSPGPVDYRAAAAAAAANAPAGASICIDSAGNETISMSPTGGEDAGVTSNGSAQPHWRSNYRGDYRGGVRPICTRDLLCWSYQVARGMQYLARRKVLHGDLAARNILLADGNIIKICDFGLAKSMYKSDNYKKKGDGPLPVKWMALESIRDGVFSTQSDVWSFGIVLWELFSLAQTPYPGMAADERLYTKLKEGWRMERPPYATHDLYCVMMNCWAANPVRRPSFDELAETLGANLEESVRNHYLDLNNAYIDMNEQWQRDGATDYLGMLGAPDYSNLVAPRDDDDYINSVPATMPSSPGTSSGYLLMRGGAGPLPGSLPGSSPATPRSAEVFSPRPGSGAQVFTFAGPRAPAAAAPIPAPTPTALDNPSYTTRPVVLNPSADNYVNMPQHKMAAATGANSAGANGGPPGSQLCEISDAFSNPSYVSAGLLSVGTGQQGYA